MTNTVTISVEVAQIVEDAASMFQWEKDQSTATKTARQDMVLELFASMRAATEAGLSDATIVNASYALGVELAKRGQGKNTIKVRRSEFRRIWENIKHVEPDCNSWKKALAQIKAATATADDRILEIKTAIENHYKAIEALEAELAEASIEIVVEDADIDEQKDGTNG